MSRPQRAVRPEKFAGARLRASAQPAVVSAQSTGPWTLWACIAALLVLTTLVFRPVLHAGFLSWDDTAYVSANKLLRDAAGLKQIWNPFAPTEDQYYPLVFTSYWMEYRLWGADSQGYHAVNVGLHLVNVVLVTALVRSLGGSAWVAIGTAAVFALHPLQVASVAWIAERKNLLSGCFYLIAFLLYLRDRQRGSWGAYAGCLLAFGAALLSKTQTVTLPASLVLVEWLLATPARLRPAQPRAIAARIAPLLAFGLLAAVVTTVIEHGNAEWPRLPTAAERPFIVAAAPWFYASKFLLPIGLSPIYPRWNLSAAGPLPWLSVVAWPVVVAVIARHRAGLGALALWGLADFLVALMPVLGLVPFGFQQHALVADHFVYLAVLGGGLAVAVWAERLAGRPGWTARRAIVCVAGLLVVAAYGVQTSREARYWRDDETFWQHVLTHNPDCLPAQQSLGFHYRSQGQWRKALPYFRRAAEIRPDHPRVFHWYVVALRSVQGAQAAVGACDRKVAEDPGFAIAYLERAESYEMLGRPQDALDDYAHVLRMAPRGSADWQAAQRGRSRLQPGATK